MTMQTQSDDVSVFPEPRAVERIQGYWQPSQKSESGEGARINVHAAGLPDQMSLLRDYLECEQSLLVMQMSDQDADIELSLDLPERPLTDHATAAGLCDEQYHLNITPQKIHLRATTSNGVAMGIQTLRQLFLSCEASCELPCVEIKDEPELAWRGLHLDVSRHFFEVEQIKRFIDLAALNKFNLFHWHLTDDQGWRLPIEGYPRLTEVAAWRAQTMIGHDRERETNPYDGVCHGGYYTHEQIREVVGYAAQRGIHVLPEVDIPGHVQALVTAYPEFGVLGTPPGVREYWGISEHVLNLEPVTMQFIEALIDTLIDLFPFRYVHLGGDEALPGQWANSPQVQKRMKQLGIAAVADVQNHFTQSAAGYLAKAGRCLIGWDEIIEHDCCTENTAVMNWRAGGRTTRRYHAEAAAAGLPVVLAPQTHTYFDMRESADDDRATEGWNADTCLPLQCVYDWQPLVHIQDEHHDCVLGGQAQLWTEYIPDFDHLMYMTYPRACALAQVLWTGPSREDWPTFCRRLLMQLSRLDRFNVDYRHCVL